MDWKAQSARTWFTAALLVALAHAGAWYGLERVRDEASPARPLKVIEAALLPQPKPPLPPPHLPPVVPPAKKALPPRPPLARVQPAPTPLAIATPAPPAVTPSPVQLVATPSVPDPTPPAITLPEPAPPVPTAPAAIEAPRFDAAYLNNPPPAYPAVARRMGQQGRVVVRVEVLPDGRSNRVELRHGSGHDLLDQAALEAVRKWRFVPARQGDVAVSAWVDVPITFRLNN